jgi:ribosomal protein S17E
MGADIKVKEVNISTDYQPKIRRIMEYWSEKQTTEIVSLLKEYQDVFSRDYKDIKGLVEEMREVKNKMILDEKLVKNQPYILVYKYHDIVKREIKNKINARIIYPVD